MQKKDIDTHNESMAYEQKQKHFNSFIFLQILRSTLISPVEILVCATHWLMYSSRFSFNNFYFEIVEMMTMNKYSCGNEKSLRDGSHITQ